MTWLRTMNSVALDAKECGNGGTARGFSAKDHPSGTAPSLAHARDNRLCVTRAADSARPPLMIFFDLFAGFCAPSPASMRRRSFSACREVWLEAAKLAYRFGFGHLAVRSSPALDWLGGVGST